MPMRLAPSIQDVAAFYHARMAYPSFLDSFPGAGVTSYQFPVPPPTNSTNSTMATEFQVRNLLLVSAEFLFVHTPCTKACGGSENYLVDGARVETAVDVI